MIGRPALYKVFDIANAEHKKNVFSKHFNPTFYCPRNFRRNYNPLPPTLQPGIRVRQVPAPHPGRRGLALPGAVIRRGLPEGDGQPARVVEFATVAVEGREGLLRGRIRTVLQGRSRHHNPY